MVVSSGKKRKVRHEVFKATTIATITVSLSKLSRIPLLLKRKSGFSAWWVQTRKEGLLVAVPGVAVQQKGIHWGDEAILGG